MRITIASLFIMIIIQKSYSDIVAKPDHEKISYGEEDRQWLNIYHPLNHKKEKNPVVLFSHHNGADAYSLSLLDTHVLRYSGFSIVSWNSISELVDMDDTVISWEDCEKVMAWMNQNSDEYCLDTDNIIIVARSRGTGASWKIAHSGDASIKGMYLIQALPDRFWINLDEWDPRNDISNLSPPVHFIYQYEPDIKDKHDPLNGYRIMIEYHHNDIVKNTKIKTSVPIYDYFSFFQEWAKPLINLNVSAYTISNDFNKINQNGEIVNGTWHESNEMMKSKKNDIVSAIMYGDENWNDYTISLNLLTRNELNPDSSYPTSRIITRYLDEYNYYETFLTKDSLLCLNSVKNGLVEPLKSVEVSTKPSKWNNLVLVMIDNKIEVFLNDEIMISIFNSDHNSGKIGIKSVYCETIYDNLKIIGNTKID